MQYSNSGGMLVALVAMVLLVLLCRWVFSTGDREQRRRPAAREGPQPRRLRPARPGRHGGEPGGAQQRRDVLTAAGIRCTVAEGLEPGTLAVLVFRADADRARPLVSDLTSR